MRHFIPVKWFFIPVKWFYIAVKWFYIPVNKHFIPVNKHFIPVNKHFIPVKWFFYSCQQAFYSCQQVFYSCQQAFYSCQLVFYSCQCDFTSQFQSKSSLSYNPFSTNVYFRLNPLNDFQKQASFPEGFLWFWLDGEQLITWVWSKQMSVKKYQGDKVPKQKQS